MGIFCPAEDEPPPQGGIGGSFQKPVIQSYCKGPYDIVSSNKVYGWPLENIGFNQYFSYYHPGVDLFAELRDPIYPAGYGFVSKAEYMPDGPNGGYGWYVIVDHGRKWQSLYAHMDEKPLVVVGDYVFPEKVLGYAGSSGNSTGVHLHFEVRKKNKDGYECYYDPRTVIDGAY